MLYATINFKTKDALKKGVAQGLDIRVFAPGIGKPKDNGVEYIEGPHFPSTSKWNAFVKILQGRVVAVL